MEKEKFFEDGFEKKDFVNEEFPKNPKNEGHLTEKLERKSRINQINERIDYLEHRNSLTLDEEQELSSLRQELKQLEDLN